jgi:CDP-glucose 4,6-dehydratase
MVERMLAHWGAEQGWDKPKGEQPHEAVLLKLDCSKARAMLGWSPRLRLDEALEKVVSWHRAAAEGRDARDISIQQLQEYWSVRSMAGVEQRAWA